MEARVKRFTCILCPRGCRLEAAIGEGSVTVGGNACPRGAQYGQREAVDPRRSLTTTVRVESRRRMLPVKTNGDIPLDRLMDAMRAIDGVVARPPVECGQALVRDLLGLGVDLVACDRVPAKGELGAVE